jgi:hypothetical protein
MIEARQEARLAPILDWLCLYCRRDGALERDERALPGPGTSVLPRNLPMEGSRNVLLRHTRDILRHAHDQI